MFCLFQIICKTINFIHCISFMLIQVKYSSSSYCFSFKIMAFVITLWIYNVTLNTNTLIECGIPYVITILSHRSNPYWYCYSNWIYYHFQKIYFDNRKDWVIKFNHANSAILILIFICLPSFILFVASNCSCLKIITEQTVKIKQKQKMEEKILVMA